MEYVNLDEKLPEPDKYVLIIKGGYMHVIPEGSAREVIDNPDHLTTFSVLTINMTEDTITKSRYF